MMYPTSVQNLNKKLYVLTYTNYKMWQFLLFLNVRYSLYLNLHFYFCVA
jgi:hypothetical protein